MFTRFAAVLTITLALVGCNQSKPATPGADLIIHGGPILTMEGDQPTYVEAVVVSSGKIVFAGSDAEAMKQKGANTVVKDLGGKTMLPGFVDPHSHFINAPTLSQQVNVSPSPVGPATRFPRSSRRSRPTRTRRRFPTGAGSWPGVMTTRW